MIVKNFTMMHEPPSDPMVIHSSAVACIGLLIASPLALMQAATTSHGCCAVAVAAAGHTHCGHCHSGFCWTGSTWWVCGGANAVSLLPDAHELFTGSCTMVTRSYAAISQWQQKCMQILVEATPNNERRTESTMIPRYDRENKRIGSKYFFNSILL